MSLTSLTLRSGEFGCDLADERMLAANLLDGTPRRPLALVLAGQVAVVPGLLQGFKDGTPRNLLVFQVFVDVMELRLDEDDVLRDVGKVCRVHADTAEESGPGFPGLALPQRDWPVPEDSGIAQPAKVIGARALDEGNVIVHHRVLDGRG